MNSEDDMAMSSGEVSESEDDMEPRQDEKRTYEKPLKIRGSLDDALRVLVGKSKAEK